MMMGRAPNCAETVCMGIFLMRLTRKQANPTEKRKRRGQ
jgi:hypothetical protein